MELERYPRRTTWGPGGFDDYCFIGLYAGDEGYDFEVDAKGLREINPGSRSSAAIRSGSDTHADTVEVAVGAIRDPVHFAHVGGTPRNLWYVV